MTAALTLLFLKGSPQHMNHWFLRKMYSASPAVDMPHAFNTMILHVFGILQLKTEQRLENLKLIVVLKT